MVAMHCAVSKRCDDVGRDVARQIQRLYGANQSTTTAPWSLAANVEHATTYAVENALYLVCRGRPWS